MTARDRIGSWEVALDLVEERRVDEAIALLDRELPDRLAIPCAACGVPVGCACQEPAMRPCGRCASTGELNSYDIQYNPTRISKVPCDSCFGTGKREIPVDRVLPHQSRILGIERRW